MYWAAISVVGIKPDEFWKMTPAEYAGVSEYKRQTEENDWRRASAIAAIMVNINTPKNKPSTPMDFLVPWKKSKEKPQLTKDQMIDMMRRTERKWHKTHSEN